jgi:hypothetical protein
VKKAVKGCAFSKTQGSKPKARPAKKLLVLQKKHIKWGAPKKPRGVQKETGKEGYNKAWFTDLFYFF